MRLYSQPPVLITEMLFLYPDCLFSFFFCTLQNSPIGLRPSISWQRYHILGPSFVTIQGDVCTSMNDLYKHRPELLAIFRLFIQSLSERPCAKVPRVHAADTPHCIELHDHQNVLLELKYIGIFTCMYKLSTWCLRLAINSASLPVYPWQGFVYLLFCQFFSGTQPAVMIQSDSKIGFPGLLDSRLPLCLSSSQVRRKAGQHRRDCGVHCTPFPDTSTLVSGRECLVGYNVARVDSCTPFELYAHLLVWMQS